MFIHLGGDVVVPLKDIIAIMDIESSSVSQNTKEFLQTADDEDFIIKISKDSPKSFILSERDNKTVIYLSPISSVTLYKRSGFLNDVSLK
ncbi:hypothetical protein SDC9_133823 [bioreactor metagenome]|jgi:hypothetical protein|uniref:DUF370 domain-containing protein n=2 Tax=root TaxID=1 RepID=A0ABT1NK90_9FIRM|nr:MULTISPECIES: extracellular matrix/biofilm biosynthesis regulator RemA family protein [Lutispora]MCQ1531687.1 DUF370 domain-containing protein [Lutispora saccharofermentans]MEA4963261.1 DUF370 domain-containing protein [Lutispora sp.]HCJ59020.1 DUF370 domain-containing protein [Clostridiaceae bacterium]